MISLGKKDIKRCEHQAKTRYQKDIERFETDPTGYFNGKSEQSTTNQFKNLQKGTK